MSRYRYDKVLDQVICVDDRTEGTPDAYCPSGGYWDENFVDEKDPKTWNGQFVRSKRHKAELLKQFRVHESGDRVHGSRNFETRRTYFT